VDFIVPFRRAATPGSSGRSCVSHRRNCGYCSLGRGHPSRSQFPTESNTPCIVALLHRWCICQTAGQTSSSKENDSVVGKINKRIVTLMEFFRLDFYYYFSPSWCKIIFILITWKMNWIFYVTC